MRRLLAIILTSLSLYASAWAAPAPAFDHALWDGLLKKHVVVLRGGQATQLDYAAMQADHAALKTYLASTSAVTRPRFDDWSAPAQLAFLINAYNAWTVELVLTRYPELGSIKDLGSFLQSPWKRSFIPLLGQTRSLDSIEHELIRGSGRYPDPRIHFAVNCASVGCPAVRAEAYDEHRLDAQLDNAAQQFLADRGRNRLDHGVLKVSSIFKWYRDDFEKGWRNSTSLGQFLAMHGVALGLDTSSAVRLHDGTLPIEFLDYDWRLNDIARASRPRP